MDRRSFLRIAGYAGLGLSFSGAIAMLDDDALKSFDPMIDFIMDKLKDSNFLDTRVADKWYKISTTHIGDQSNPITIKFATADAKREKFGYLAIIQQSKDSASYCIGPDSTAVQFRNITDLTQANKDDVTEEMFKSIKGHKSSMVKVVNIDSSDYKRTIKEVYTALGGQ